MSDIGIAKRLLLMLYTDSMGVFGVDLMFHRDGWMVSTMFATDTPHRV